MNASSVHLHYSTAILSVAANLTLCGVVSVLIAQSWHASFFDSSVHWPNFILFARLSTIYFSSDVVEPVSSEFSHLDPSSSRTILRRNLLIRETWVSTNVLNHQFWLTTGTNQQQFLVCSTYSLKDYSEIHVCIASNWLGQPSPSERRPIFFNLYLFLSCMSTSMETARHDWPAITAAVGLE